MKTYRDHVRANETCEDMLNAIDSIEVLATHAILSDSKTSKMIACQVFWSDGDSSSLIAKTTAECIEFAIEYGVPTSKITNNFVN